MPFFDRCSLQTLSVLLIWTAPVDAQSQIALTTDQKTYIGRPIAHNQQICWLSNEAGRYSQVLFRDVISFSKHPEPFQIQTSVKLREQLKAELGRSYEVVIQSHFIVAGPPGRTKAYAKLLDRMARSFSRYISVRKLPAANLEYPLVVIIFPDRNAFQVYSQAEEIKSGRFLQGYYHPHTNRIALFETPTQAQRVNSASTAAASKEFDALPPATAATLIHEGIHQLAFNSGLHSRIGQNPRWIVEGLATMLEADRNLNLTQSPANSSLNLSRLRQFKAYRASTRKETIAEFIANDEQFFNQSILDAYSQAWALTYFLAEEYPAAYPQYLKRVAERDPLDPNYSPQERLTDFQSIFSKDLAWLEVKFLRFVERLEVPED